MAIDSELDGNVNKYNLERFQYHDKGSKLSTLKAFVNEQQIKQHW